MARKPEAVFKEGVHRHLPPKEQLYRQSMYTPYGSGTPDHYYEAPKKHLWVEYKFLDKVPLKGTTVGALLSPQQLEWAKRAIRNNQPWACIVGVGRGREGKGFVASTLHEVLNCSTVLLTKEEIAAWICLSVGLSIPRSKTSSSPKKSPARSVSRTKCRPTATDSQR